MKVTPWLLSGPLLASCLAAQAVAQATADRAGDERAIRSVVAAFVEAVGRGDAKAVAGLFTESGEAIATDGRAIRGRKALEAHYASRFAASPGEKLEAIVELVAYLAPGLARQDGRSKLIPAGGGAGSATRYTTTFVKLEGRWLVASLRELDDQGVGHHEQLEELAWLVGDWVEESGGGVVTTAIAWSEDGNYLLRSFEIQVGGSIHLKGTQRIGWDPLTRQVISWIFDSRGGYEVGHWTRNGDQWVIKSTGVHPDGLTTSATQTLGRIKKDRLHWGSTARTLGGEALGDIQEVVMVRRPPATK